MGRDTSTIDCPGEKMTSDLVAVLLDLTPELEGLMGAKVRFFTVLPPGQVPVGLVREAVERVILVIVARMCRCVGKGGWIMAGVDRINLSGPDAAPLSLAPGGYARLRIAARLNETVNAPPFVKLAAGVADSVAEGLGGRTLRALVARRAAAVQLESVPGAGITATVFLRSPTGKGGRQVDKV